MSEFWKQIHENKYKGKDWTEKPSLFAVEITRYLPNGGRLLDLGAGQGQDSIYFAEQGYDVLSTDFEPTALEKTKSKIAASSLTTISTQHVDLQETLPFDDGSFDIVYAHLSLHYFEASMTKRILGEIHRVLKPGGVLAFLVNSVNDPEYNTGTKLESDYFETEGTRKRYSSVETAKTFAKDFKVILCDENGETYKDRAKDVHNLVRYIGRK